MRFLLNASIPTMCLEATEQAGGDNGLAETLALFEEEDEIPVVSRVGQFQQRDRGNKLRPDPNYEELVKKGGKPTTPPCTPPRRTSTPEPSSKKDHELAKKLQRAERLHSSDHTKRYLFEQPILPDECELPPLTDVEKDAMAARVQDCFRGVVGRDFKPLEGGTIESFCGCFYAGTYLDVVLTLT